jgi:hypothetical protein
MDSSFREATNAPMRVDPRAPISGWRERICSNSLNEISADSLELYRLAWYRACSNNSQPMKQANTCSNPDQNWHWPEKTWFRERLNAIKAREQETRQKVPTANATTEPVDSITTAKGDPKND